MLSAVGKTLLVLIAACVPGPNLAAAQELPTLPLAPSAESLQRASLLLPISTPQLAELSWAKRSVPIFRRQAIWPLRVQTENGTVYWGEVTKIDEDTFDLLNRRTKQKATLAYSSVRSIGIAKTYPRTKPPTSAEKTLHFTGAVIEIILLLPVRILELFLIPQC